MSGEVWLRFYFVLLIYYSNANQYKLLSQEWRRQRKVIGPAFRQFWSTEPFGEIMPDLFNQIDKRNGKKIPMEYMMKR